MEVAVEPMMLKLPFKTAASFLISFNRADISRVD